MYYVPYTPPKSFVIPKSRNDTREGIIAAALNAAPDAQKALIETMIAPLTNGLPYTDANSKEPAKEEDIKDWWEQNSD